MPKKGIDFAQWKTGPVEVSGLSLDPTNIRLELQAKSQAEILNDLFVNEDAFQLVKSIVDGGFFPDELPIVIKKNGDIIVIEGNRRIAALKAIIDPSIAHSHSKRISALLEQRKTPPIKTIQVVYAPNREDALQLLAMKHTPTTRRPWKPLRKAYFYYAQYKAGKTIEQLKEAYPGVEVDEFVKMWEMHEIAKSMQYDSSVVEEKVHSPRLFPITTLKRLYDDPFFRDYMGIQFDGNGQVKIAAVKNDFEKAFTKIVTDLTSGAIDSREINDTKGIKRYLKKVPRPAIQQAHKTLGVLNFTPRTIPAVKSKQLVPDDIVCNLPSPGVKRMLDEMRRLNYARFPNASADLLRSLLECSIKAYYVNRKDNITPKKGNKFVQLKDVLTKFKDDSNTPQRLKQVAQQVISGSSFFSSCDFLNAVNHNPDLYATDKEVKEAWDKLEPILREVYQ